MNKQDILLQSICAAYPGLRIASVEFNGDGQNNDVLVINMDRVWFYQGTFALEEALFGIENGDPKAFESGIAQYK